MKFIISFLILLMVLAFVQMNRNHCNWHGSDQALGWAECSFNNRTTCRVFRASREEGRMSANGTYRTSLPTSEHVRF